MTDKTHPITPPPELVQQWIEKYNNTEDPHWQTYEQDIATQAARWGADQELEACCEVLRQKGVIGWSMLRSNRRPKPPSLKEQALKLLNDYGVPFYRYSAEQTETIRRALEQLDE